MLRAALAALALTALASPALADIPPPPGYVEQCTVDKQREAGEECVSCSTYHGEPDKCEKAYGEAGYTRRCRTRGASVWSEVWCRKIGTGKPVGPIPGEEIKPIQPEPAPTPDEPAPTPDEPPAPTPDDSAVVPAPTDAPTPTEPTPADAPTVDPGTPTTVIPAPPTEPTPAPPVEGTPATPTPPATPDAPEATKKKSGCAGGPVTAPLFGLVGLLALRRRRRAPRA